MKRLIGAICFLLLLPGLLWADSGFFVTPEEWQALGKYLESIRQTSGELERLCADLNSQLNGSMKELGVSRGQLAVLRQAVSDLKGISEAQGAHLWNLENRLAIWEQTSAAQASYIKKLQKGNKAMRITLWVGVPAALAAGLLAGLAIGK